MTGWYETSYRGPQRINLFGVPAGQTLLPFWLRIAQCRINFKHSLRRQWSDVESNKKNMTLFNCDSVDLSPPIITQIQFPTSDNRKEPESINVEQSLSPVGRTAQSIIHNPSNWSLMEPVMAKSFSLWLIFLCQWCQVCHIPGQQRGELLLEKRLEDKTST